MKKIFYVLPVSFFLLIACEKVTETYADPTLQLEVTSQYVIFGADGGTKTVIVTSNTEWTVSYDATWFSVVKGDGALEITVFANYMPENHQGDVTVAAVEDESLTRTISIAQTSVEGINLSEDESANCYIVSTGTTYRFDALVKGNGIRTETGGVGAYADKYDVSIDSKEIVYADLLWESTFNGDKSGSHDIIDGDPIYSNGYVYFTTGGTEGNAVIAIKNAGGEILWSWHIWVCDSEMTDVEGNGYYWQDRNLGAISNKPGDINNRGLLYQWGRKDPFLPSCAEYGATNADVLNYQVGDGSGSWNYNGYFSKIETAAPGNIPISVKKPMTVILPYGNVYSWYLIKPNDDNCNSFLWGDSSNPSSYVKSIFDPCPPGYTIPVADAWTSTKDANVSVWSTDTEYGRLWAGADNAFYPAAGSFSGVTAALANTSVYGCYWSSAMYASDSYTVCKLYFNMGTTLSYTYDYPVHAMSVRCMRVK